jgi:hypothetical protein
MQGRTLWRALFAWLIITAYLAAVAYDKRLLWQDQLAARIVKDAQATAEHGKVDFWRYLYGDWSGKYWIPAWQASGVYLIERGRHFPELERTLLLLEARRTMKAHYVSPWCFNWDLRSKLIEHCLAHYPDDVRVAWAAGRIYMTAGKYAPAAEQLKRVLDSGLDPQQIGDDSADFLLNRYLAALTMLGRLGDAEQYVAGRAAAGLRSADARFTYLDFLCREGKYAQLIPLGAQARLDFSQDTRFRGLLKRAAWWTGDIDAYRRLLAEERGPGAAPEDLHYADPRLALIDGDYALADRLLAWPGRPAYRAYAETYGVTQKAEIMQHLLAERRRINAPQGLTREDNAYWDSYDAIEADAVLCGQVMRGYVLAREWDKAAAFDAALPREAHEEYYYEYGGSAGRQMAWLFSTLALGQPLRLRSIDALVGSGGLPGLLEGEHFAAALAAGPYSREEALRWVRLLAQPELQRYSDTSNGELEWPAGLRASRR